LGVRVVGLGDGGGVALGGIGDATVEDASGEGTTAIGAAVGEGASVTPATVWSKAGPPRARAVPTRTIKARVATMNGAAFGTDLLGGTEATAPPVETGFAGIAPGGADIRTA
jgi:hypothetical protein